MSTRIERNFAFQAAVYLNGEFILNLYNLKINMNVVTACAKEQQIASERIKYFLSDCLQNSVFIQSSEERAIEKFKDADIKVCTLPDEAYDQTVCIAIFNKLNAIAEGRITIEEITIGSTLNDDVKLIFSKEESIGPFSMTGWWDQPTLSINDILKKKSKQKIVKLQKLDDWAEFDLMWANIPADTTETKQIYFINDLEK
jgi:hypothetical protein